MARRTVKVREGGPNAEKKYINPDPGFSLRRRPDHAADTIKKNLGSPLQQLNVATTTHKSSPYSAVTVGNWENATYNQQMKDAAKITQLIVKIEDLKMGGTGDSSYKSSDYIGIKQLDGWQVPEWHDRNLNNNATKLNIGGVKVTRNKISDHINPTYLDKMYAEALR